MSRFIQIVTTANSREQAEQIAEQLVTQREAACVQISGPVTSLYHWQGKMERAEEWLCTVKTCQTNYVAVEKIIHEVHPYDTPEIIATEIVSGSSAYLNWIADELGQK